MKNNEINLEPVHHELTQVFQAYEKALMDNDVEALNGYFWPDARVTRYGIADKQIGFDALVDFRRKTPAPDFTRELHDVRITTFGFEFGTWKKRDRSTRRFTRSPKQFSLKRIRSP